MESQPWLVAGTLALVAPFGAVLGLGVNGGSTRRAGSIALATLALAVPFALPTVWHRALMSLALAVTWLRVVELALDERPVPAPRRALHVASMMEMRRTPRVPAAFHTPSLVRSIAFGATAAAAVAIIVHVPDSPDLRTRALRWACCVVASYTSFDAIAATAVLVWRGLGFAQEIVHDDPIKSRTVTEFWSRRWNRIVGGWLRDQVFRRFARRKRAEIGIAAAFVASTLLHVYLAWATLDAKAALMWGAFFLAQIPVVFVERALGVAAWRPFLGRAWTGMVLLALSPLFMTPMLRCFDALR